MLKKDFTALYGKTKVHVVEFWPNGSTVQSGAYYVVEFEPNGERVRVAPSRLTLSET